MEKRERGSNITLPIILRLLGRMSSGEKEKRKEIKIQKKMGMGKKIKL